MNVVDKTIETEVQGIFFKTFKNNYERAQQAINS